MRKVVKFGGTSLADSSQFRKVRDIVLEDEARTIVIPSAPGRHSANDLKVTALAWPGPHASCVARRASCRTPACRPC